MSLPATVMTAGGTSLTVEYKLIVIRFRSPANLLLCCTLRSRNCGHCGENRSVRQGFTDAVAAALVASAKSCIDAVMGLRASCTVRGLITEKARLYVPTLRSLFTEKLANRDSLS